MPRDRREMEGGDDEIDLVPFMNMVVILIPLLLLSVVFLKVGVVNITAPKLSVGPPSKEKPDDKEEEPLNLTVAINDEGFRIAATGTVLSPVEGCPESGPTICLRNKSKNIGEMVKRARKTSKKDEDEGDKLFRKVSESYDWMTLYNRLMKIKKEYPDETVVNVSGDPDIPYNLIIRAMDVARYKLEKDSYNNREDFWQASIRKSESGEGKFARLFSDPVLAVAK